MRTKLLLVLLVLVPLSMSASGWQAPELAARSKPHDWMKASESVIGLQRGETNSPDAHLSVVLTDGKKERTATFVMRESDEHQGVFFLDDPPLAIVESAFRRPVLAWAYWGAAAAIRWRGVNSGTAILTAGAYRLCA